MKVEDLIKLFSYDDIYTMYIVENTPQKDAPSLLNITAKDFRRLLTFYGIRKDPKMARKNNKYVRSHEEYVRLGKKSAETQKKNWANKSDEEKEEWARYCSEVQLNLPKEKRDSMTSKMLDTNSKKTQEELDLENEKRANTLRKTWKLKSSKFNHRKSPTLKDCASSIELTLFELLKTRFGSDDVSYNIRVDDRYPYKCDFYIKSLDIFIEINAHWTHGIHPFSDKTDKDKLDIWRRKAKDSQFYKNAIKVWIGSDPKKYETAKANNLNYIRLYPSVSLEENLEINNNNFPDMIKFLYENRN